MRPYRHVHQTALYLAGHLLRMAASEPGETCFTVTRGPTGEERCIGRYTGEARSREQLVFDLVRDFNAHGLDDEIHISATFVPAQPAGRIDLDARIEAHGISFAARAAFGDAVN